MKRYLFIAEKKSLMLDVQNCYRKHKAQVVEKVGEIDFIALSGHLCRNCEPDAYDEWNGLAWDAVDYPMIPTRWKVEPINDSFKKKILKDIEENMDDYDGFIAGTDSDIEGYGIYYIIAEYLKIHDRESLRFIEHSLTDEEILESLMSMTDIHTDPVHVRATNSYLVRSRADWMYGMNVTRMVSNKQGEVMTVGRVKAPTIRLVYDNSMAIDNFKSKKYYQVESDYGDFVASLMDKDGGIAQFDEQSQIKLYPLEGAVKSIEKNRVTEHAPKLFELTALQIEAGQKFGYAPNQTLEYAQSLYEKHKVISYPRTQCPYISKAKSMEFKMMLSHMDVFPELAPYLERITDSDIRTVQNDKQVVNDAEVQKESHDALLPTSKRPVLSEMTQDEINICRMIFTRLIAQFLPKGSDDKTKLVIAHGDGDFVARGTMVVEQGWRALYSEKKDKHIPVLEKGETITAKKISPVEKKTSPPKRLTSSSLVDAMKHVASKIDDEELKKTLAESNGIGTPATRGAIIEDILKRGYVEEKKKALYITPLGIRYIHAIESLDIASPVFAANMDNEMKKVKRGEADYDAVYNQVLEDLRNTCRQIEKMESAVKTINVKCPICGGELRSGRFKYECGNGDFSIQKAVCGKEIDEKLLGRLIAGETSPIMQFKKKDGTKFEAKLIIQNNSLCFDTSVADTNCSCPKCGEKLKADRFSYVCGKCGLKVQKMVCGKAIDEKLLEKLLAGETSQQYTFKKKDGTAFKAKLKIENSELVFDFSSGIECPKCKKADVNINKAGAFCDCGLRVFRNIAGKELSDTDLKTILTKGKTQLINGFKGKSGKEFSAVLNLKEDGTAEFVFDVPLADCKCPKCGNETVKMGKAGAFCDCGLKVFRNVAGKELSDAVIKNILTKGQTAVISGFKGKSGKEFSAAIKLKEDGTTEFVFDSPDSNVKCPMCGNNTVKINKGGAFCDCGLKVFRNMAGHAMTDKELQILLTKGKTREIKDFESKSGNTFSAKILLVDGRTEFEFSQKDAE